MYMYTYTNIMLDIMYIRRPLQSVEGVRLQPSKSTTLFKIQAQAARQQPKQPKMTHASSSPGWMVQNLINSFSRGHRSVPQGTTGCHRAPEPEPRLPPWPLN